MLLKILRYFLIVFHNSLKNNLRISKKSLNKVTFVFNKYSSKNAHVKTTGQIFLPQQQTSVL